LIILYVGLIHLALPNAKIINLRRHPMATGYAVYKYLFTNAYPFSYDLTDIGNYYVAYDKLIQHWTNILPGIIHTVGYEDLVENTESSVRTLLEYCDLPWEEGCLKFFENKQASTTASASQVRENMYTSSVAQWRNYQKQLAPLENILLKAGLEI